MPSSREISRMTRPDEFTSIRCAPAWPRSCSSYLASRPNSSTSSAMDMSSICFSNRSIFSLAEAIM